MSKRENRLEELQTLLTAPGQPVSQRLSGMRKVVSLMLRGRDMSPFAGMMVQQAQLPSIEARFLLSAYLLRYARQNSDLVLLVVNSLLMDAQDASDLLKGMASRTGCGLVDGGWVGIVKRMVASGVDDRSVYVRLMSVYGLAQLRS
jgi:vesicle coat complex subunit